MSQDAPAPDTPAPASPKRPSRRLMRTLAGSLALIAGAGAAFAHPPWSIWAGLLGYPLLLVLSERAPGWRSAFGLGWLAGFAYFFIGCWWVAEAFLVNAEAHAWMAPFAASLLPAGLALFWAVACALYRRFSRGGARRVLLFAALFCALEWLRGHVLTGLPWNPAGAAWPAGSAPSQAAALVGVYGLSLLTVFAVSTPAVLFRPGLWKPKAGMIALGALALAALFVGGSLRLAGAEVTRTSTVVRIVQPDVDQTAKWDAALFETVVRRYLNLTSDISGARPDVVVWPEGALPITANDAFGSWVGEAMDQALEPGQTLLAGFSRAEPGEDGEPRYFNSLFVLHDDGQALRVSAIYDKHRLVPFGEYLPAGNLMSATGLRALVHVPADFSHGPRPAPVEVPGAPRVQPLICYESLYPGFTSTAGGRPGWIVNISNDAWFGRTSGPLQHLNLAAYRSIETGLPMVRATPTGVSALIDPWGRVVGDPLEAGESGVLDVRLPEATARPPYAIYGDAILAALVLLMIAASSTRGRIMMFSRDSNGSRGEDQPEVEV